MPVRHGFLEVAILVEVVKFGPQSPLSARSFLSFLGDLSALRGEIDRIGKSENCLTRLYESHGPSVGKLSRLV